MKKLSILAIALLTVAGVSAKYAPNYGATINLGGATLAAPYMKAAIALYNSIFPCPTVTYKQTALFAGSGNGRAAVYNGTLDASVSDAVAPATETANLPDCFLQIPFILSSVSIIMNPPATVLDSMGNTFTVIPANIRLTGADLCAIYTANDLEDPAIYWETYLAQPYNANTALTMPGYTAPPEYNATQINIFARLDNSGTSAIFTTYLNTSGDCTSVPANTQTIFTGNPPTSTIFPLASPVTGSSGMLSAVNATQNSMGYVGTGDNLAQTAPLPTALLAVSNATLPTPPTSDFVSPTNINVMAAQINNPSCTDLVSQPNAYPMVEAELFDVFGTQATSWLSCNISQFILFLLTQGQKLNVPGFVTMTQACLTASLLNLDSISTAICNPCVPQCIPCASPEVCPVTCPTCPS